MSAVSFPALAMSSICALHIVLSIKRLKILRPDKDPFAQTALWKSSEDMIIELFDAWVIWMLYESHVDNVDYHVLLNLDPNSLQHSPAAINPNGACSKSNSSEKVSGKQKQNLRSRSIVAPRCTTQLCFLPGRFFEVFADLRQGPLVGLQVRFGR